MQSSGSCSACGSWLGCNYYRNVCNLGWDIFFFFLFLFPLDYSAASAKVPLSVLSLASNFERWPFLPHSKDPNCINLFTSDIKVPISSTLNNLALCMVGACCQMPGLLLKYCTCFRSSQAAPRQPRYRGNMQTWLDSILTLNHVLPAVTANGGTHSADYGVVRSLETQGCSDVWPVDHTKYHLSRPAWRQVSGFHYCDD